MDCLNEGCTFSITHFVLKILERLAEFEESLSFKPAGLLPSSRVILGGFMHENEMKGYDKEIKEIVP